MAPSGEPARQGFFIGRCHALLEERKKAAKKAAMTFHLATFGCQMNAKDSEKLAGILEACGFVETEGEEADLVLYNTCTVRENANLRVYGRLGRLNGLKKKNPGMIIALCGCMMQEKEVVDKIRKSYPFVDIVFGTHNIFKLAELVAQRLDGTGMVVDVWDKAKEIVEELPADRKYPFKSGVNIMFGCNNFCSYCIVPYVRGRERSREPGDIVKEVERLAADGVVEVMLLGQNVNSYGKDLAHPITFAQLLGQVEQVEGLERIRFMTSHPKDLSGELVQALGASRKVCRHLHLPLQSGSSRILEKMNRKYTKDQYLALVEEIRRAVPGISLTTDIIVGFPGETEEDFLETMEVVDQVGFDSAFTFIYSKRTGTPAAAMEGQVPEDVVKDRFDRLLNRVQSMGAKCLERKVGKVERVLVEEVDSHLEGYVTGRLDNNAIVHLKGRPSLVGKLVEVRLKESRGFYYMGDLAE